MHLATELLALPQALVRSAQRAVKIFCRFGSRLHRQQKLGKEDTRLALTLARTSTKHVRRSYIRLHIRVVPFIQLALRKRRVREDKHAYGLNGSL